MSIAQIKELALVLSVEQRVDLAQLLWSSLYNHSPDVSLDEAAFCKELQRRDEEMSTDPSIGLTHEEVMAKARRQLGC